MKWGLTLHGGKHHGEHIVFDAENSDEARRKAVQEMKKRNAMVFELEKLD